MASKLFLVVTPPQGMLVKPVVDAVFFSREAAADFINEGSEHYQYHDLIAEVNAGFDFVGSFAEGLTEDYYA